MKVIAVSSGKGGVGKTSLAINLAISMTRFGHRVMVVDTDMGLGNVDLMLGITPRHNLSHVVEGKKKFDEIVISGPSGIRIVPASSGGKRPESFGPDHRRRIMDEVLASEDIADTVFVDTGAGITDNIVEFLLLSDEVFIVTTPEPTSIMDSYGVVRTLSQEKEKIVVKLIINMVGDRADAQHVLSTMNLVTRQFLNVEFEYLGWVRFDSNLPKSIRQQQPLVVQYPSSGAARDIERIAMKLADYEVDFLTERGIGVWFRRILSYFK